MMMPPDNITKKDQEIINQGSKIKTTRPTPTPPPEQGVLKCPRCDSPNTKFCYYNNYSLTQPRHFCKTCRRYWTNGGALRNVPIGGGCRKNHNKKKVKKTSSSYSSSSISSRLSCDSSSKDSASSSSELSAGLRFFHINNSSSPSLEFHLGGLPLIPPRLHQQQQQQQPSFTNQFSSFGATSAASSFQLDPSGGDPDSLIGLNHPFSSSTGSGLVQGMNNSSMNVNSTSSSALASSIESLSSMNQDLHWKLQQQRLAMMFTGGDNNNNQKDKDSCGTVSLPQVNKPQPILFQNLEISKPEMFQAGSRKGQGPSGDAPIEWFFGTDPTTTTTTTITSSVVNGHDENAANNNWGSGVHAWGDVQQPYSVLP